jgi:Leucine Rich repeat
MSDDIPSLPALSTSTPTSRNLRHVRVGPGTLHVIREKYKGILQHLWLGPTFSSATTLALIAENMPMGLQSIDLDLSLLLWADRLVGSCGSSSNGRGEVVDLTQEMEHFIRALPTSLVKLCLRFPTRPDSLPDICVQALAAAMTSQDNNSSPQWIILDLRGNKITNQGAIALAEALPFQPSLRHVNLEWNDIGNAGAIALAEKFQSCKLELLNLSYNPSIDDNAVQAMSWALQTNRALKELDLAGNREITTVGLTCLLECLQLHNVTLERFHWKHPRGPTRHDPRQTAAASSATTNDTTCCSSDENTKATNKKLPPTEEELLGSIEYWLSLNRAGRRLVASRYTTEEKIPLSLWPWVLAKVTVTKGTQRKPREGPDELYFLLQQNPELFDSTAEAAG